MCSIAKRTLTGQHPLILVGNILHRHIPRHHRCGCLGLPCLVICHQLSTVVSHIEPSDELLLGFLLLRRFPRFGLGVCEVFQAADQDGALFGRCWCWGWSCCGVGIVTPLEVDTAGKPAG